MSRTPDSISLDMRRKLLVTAPGLSLALGTVERKIVDCTAEAISESSIDQYLIGSLLDVEGKSGLELEQFLGLYGFARYQGRPAEGVVRLELTTVSTQDITIPQGTQFFTKSNLPGSGTPLYFAATQTLTLAAGSYTIDVPVEAVVPGVIGNVPPDTITSVSSIIGTASVTNLTAMTGGVDVETDDELRQRFKETFLRNIAGTEDWFKGLAYQNKNVTKAIVFGPTTVYRTQVVVPSTTLSLPVTNDVKYVWADGDSVFKNLGQEDEIFYTRVNDYTISSGASPVLTRDSSGDLVVGDVVDVEFEYVTTSSRNDPSNGITNKIDVFVNGTDPYTITERTIIRSTTLSSTPSNELYTGKFRRVGSPGSPSASNRFMRLGSTPVVSFPPTLTIASTTYELGTHYHLLKGTTLLAGSHREVAGIEWDASGPSTDTEITITYTYNRVPEILNTVMNKGKQICTDVLVHEAEYKYLKIYLSIEIDRGYVVSQVTNAIQNQLRAFFQGQNYGAWMEISDINLAVHQVLGVDNVKLTTNSEDATFYGIQVYNNPLDPSPANVYTDDFKLKDNTLPIFLEAVVLRKANA